MTVGRRLEHLCKTYLDEEDNDVRMEIAQEMLRFLVLHIGITMPEVHFNLLSMMGEIGFE